MAALQVVAAAVFSPHLCCRVVVIRTVRLWNLTRPQCLAVLEFPDGYGTPHVAYDQQGLVFAAATFTGKANIIKLYDARNVRAWRKSRKSRAAIFAGPLCWKGSARRRGGVMDERGIFSFRVGVVRIT